MRMNKVLLAALAMTLMACVRAETPVEANMRKLIEPRLGDGVKIESIRETPYNGLYELYAGGEIFYTDKGATFLIAGTVFDIKSAQNLTKARIDDLNKVKFTDLPLASAMKVVKGNGKRVIAVFEDPNCGYCKRLRQTTLKDIDNVTIYTFLYNILAEDSFVKSKNVWCASDRNKAWDDWMLNGKAAAEAPDACTTPNQKIFELGRKLNVTATPTIFFADGSRIPGAIDLRSLEAKLATVK